MAPGVGINGILAWHLASARFRYPFRILGHHKGLADGIRFEIVKVQIIKQVTKQVSKTKDEA